MSEHLRLFLYVLDMSFAGATSVSDDRGILMILMVFRYISVRLTFLLFSTNNSLNIYNE